MEQIFFMNIFVLFGTFFAHDSPATKRKEEQKQQMKTKMLQIQQKIKKMLLMTAKGRLRAVVFFSADKSHLIA